LGSVKPSVYVETTVVSYLTAWASKDVIRAAHQQLTREWWDSERDRFDLFTSQFVVVECRRGDSVAAAERLRVLDSMQALDITESAEKLALALVREQSLPSRAAADALHIAIAAVNGLDYLLTWNCRHMANGIMRPAIERVCRDQGYEPPIICTPAELHEVEP